MTRLLAYLPKRFHHFALEYGALTLVSLVALTATGAFFLYFKIEPHHHDGYHRVAVDFTDTVASERSPPRHRVYFTDEEGSVATAMTRRLVVAQGITSHACVERRSRSSGRHTYKLVSGHLCEQTRFGPDD
ncbi:hypothetical protein [Thalassococcus sp. S3]|uniref:hypothetical protein n=1 Tax=Thalassococcus sp. S3 TaxID=2017482 RepID=UPI0010241FEC|nr:hypothetical protein [Thalassococcus sp. S3]QBF31714.1 hypothetical protein CFI11_10850 [Thalassococcus sp. S3]